MPTHKLMNLLGGVCGRLAPIPLIAVLLVDPQVASAEPLGYVLRPDRQDVGVLDSRDDTTLGGIPLSTRFANNIGQLSFVSLSPDGRVGLVGATRMGLGRMDVLSGSVIETVRPGPGPSGTPEAVDATAAAFHPDSKIAYVSLFSGELLEVDTSNGRVEILRSFPAPTYLQLFYVQPQREEGPLSRPLLIGLQEDGRIAAFDLERGQEIDPSSGFGIQLGRFDPVVNMTVEPDVSIWALTHEGVVQHMPSWALDGNTPPIEVASVVRALVGLTTHFAVGEGGRGLYLANQVSAFKVECFDIAPTPGMSTSELSEISEPVAPCPPTRLVITEIELGEVTKSGEVLPPDVDNPIGDVALTSDEATLYVVGRRTIFRIDTATAELVAGFRMRAGGGELSQIAIGEAVLPCVPQSTSLLALRNEADEMNTSQTSRNKVRFKVDKARSELRAGDIANGRSQLQQAIARTTARSNLPEGDADHILPDEAASVICAAGNLLERVRLN